MTQQPQDFESAKSRLEEIANAVSDETLPLDEILDLFEEAVAVGLKIGDLVDDGIVVDDEAILAEGLPADAATSAGADVSDATAASDEDDTTAAGTAGDTVSQRAYGVLPGSSETVSAVAAD